MSPEQRRQLLERLPAARREVIERRLRTLDNLTPAERARLRTEYQRFLRLAPAAQQQMRRLYRRFQSLPGERQKILSKEFRRLRNLSLPQRERRLRNPRYRAGFSPQELHLLEQIAKILPPPEPQTKLAAERVHEPRR